MLIMKRSLLQSRGFTVVELIVVIVVIGILAGIVTLSYQGIQRNTREATLHGDLRETAQEIEAYRSQNSRYPKYLGAINNLQGASPSDTTTLEYAYVGGSAQGSYCLQARSKIDTSQVYRMQSGGTTIQTGACTQPLTPTATPSAPRTILNADGSDSILMSVREVNHIIFNWKDPLENGGSSITSYRVRFSFAGACAGQPDYVITFNALSPGGTYSNGYYITRAANSDYTFSSFNGTYGTCSLNNADDLASVHISAANSKGYGDELSYVVQFVG